MILIGTSILVGLHIPSLFCASNVSDDKNADRWKSKTSRHHFHYEPLLDVHS